LKNFFKVLLLQAPVPGAHNRLVAKPSAIPPLGLGYLASVLIQNGFDVKIIDMDIEDVGPTEIKQILFNYQPKIVGISSTSLTYKNSLRVSKIIKDVLPNCIVCLGGPHVSIE